MRHIQHQVTVTASCALYDEQRERCYMLPLCSARLRTSVHGPIVSPVVLAVAGRHRQHVRTWLRM